MGNSDCRPVAPERSIAVHVLAEENCIRKVGIRKYVGVPSFAIFWERVGTDQTNLPLT